VALDRFDLLGVGCSMLDVGCLAFLHSAFCLLPSPQCLVAAGVFRGNPADPMADESTKEVVG
jgi:hypothetical protein